MTSSVSEAGVAATVSAPIKHQYVIELFDSDDDEVALIAVPKISFSAASNPIDVDLIDLSTPPQQSLSNQHQRQQQQQQQPEIVDLLDTKPAARKDPDEDLDRKMSPKKRTRFSDVEMLSNEVEIVKVGESNEQSPLMNVLEVFPDVALDHVKKLLADHNGNAESVVSAILSVESYPKEQSAAGATDGSVPGGTPLLRRSSSVVVERLRSEPKYDYSSPNAFQPSPGYLAEAIEQLMYDFSFLKMPVIRCVFKKHHNKYTLARRHIHDAIVGMAKLLDMGPKVAASGDETKNAKKRGTSPVAIKPVDEKEENQHYQVLKAALIRGNVSGAVVQRLGQDACVQRPRRKIGTARPAISDEILQDEVRHFEQDLQEWIEKVQKRLRREAARKMSLENGSSISCECCYEDVAASECVPCKDIGHMFCCECVQQYVETQVFGSGSLGIDRRTKKPATEILCCSGECTSGFQDILLKKILPAKTWEKYCELQHIAVVEQACLCEEISTCSKCGFRAYVPETQILFECPVKDCFFVSCKKCGKEPHIPLRCEEVVQRKRQDEGRLKIEEALSEAKMRTCPKCKQKFIKETGCNKMVCRCGLKLCYVCRSPLDNENPYSHFCQAPHCKHENCGKCKLHSNTEEDDAQAMREAGISAAERYKTEIQKEDGDDEGASKVEFDVDQMMQDPARRQRLPRIPGPRRMPVAREDKNIGLF